MLVSLKRRDVTKKKTKVCNKPVLHLSKCRPRCGDASVRKHKGLRNATLGNMITGNIISLVTFPLYISLSLYKDDSFPAGRATPITRQTRLSPALYNSDANTDALPLVTAQSAIASAARKLAPSFAYKMASVQLLVASAVLAAISSKEELPPGFANATTGRRLGRDVLLVRRCFGLD